MNTLKLALLGFLLFGLIGCYHPLEIRGKGEGDIVTLPSGTGTRSCSLEDYLGASTNCTENLVNEAYNETYTAIPRAGSQFRRWDKYCRRSSTNDCNFKFNADSVDLFAGITVPPLIAVFRPIANTGLNMLFMGDDSFDDIAAGVEAHALAAGFTDHVTTRFSAAGDSGAPMAFWNSPEQTLIQAVLDGGDIDLVGMTYFPSYPEAEGYINWVKYALNKNPDTRFLISTPWSTDLTTNNTSALFEADFEATHAQVHALIDSLRDQFPGVDFYCINSGQSAVELYALEEAANLPDVTGLIGAPADSVFENSAGRPGEILADMAQLTWLAAIYEVDLTTYVYAPPYITDIKMLGQNVVDSHEKGFNAPPQAYPDEDGDGIPDRYDPVELVELLPAATRGVYQAYPEGDGAVFAPVETAPWGVGPLQIIEKYSAGMDVTGNAHRVLVAQMLNSPAEFVLFAGLEGISVEDLSAGIALTPTASYQGYSMASVDGTGLELAQIGTRTLAVGPRAALEVSLDVYAGVGAEIGSGLLSEFLPVLDFAVTGTANTFIYGLPGLYGPVSAPGNGDFSLAQSRAVSGFFRVEGDALSGAMLFFGNNMADFKAKMQEQLTGFTAPKMSMLGDIGAINLGGLSLSNDLRPLLKTLIHDMNAVDYADYVLHGQNLPWLNFEVGGNPAAIFINFEFKGPTEIANFEAAHLPTGFNLVPFRMVETDTSRYMMVLNIYQSSGGLVEGARAEWSVFVEDPNTPDPRFMVVQAKAENISADSVTPGFLTTGEPVTYAEEGGALVSYVGAEDPNTMLEETYFAASIPWPQPPSTHVPFARSFMPANDFVFWGNGVADKTLYNSTAVNRDAAVVPAGGFTLTDNSIWTPFLKTDPLNAVVYLNKQEIVISPWINLDAPYLDVSAQLLQDLIDFKNNFYPLTARNVAKAAIQGAGVALSPWEVATTEPTVHYHFSLTDASGLLNAVAPVGTTYTPAAVELFEDEAAANYVTLSVYEREGDPCGLRAEWSTYVVGADGRPETLRLDSMTSDACLDSMSLLSPAADMSHSVSANQIDTHITSPFIQFDASVDLDFADDVLTGLNWLEARERVCSLNNICDEFYYDGELVTTAAQRADNAATQVLTISTPWDAYMDTGSARAGVRQNSYRQVFNPWRNLRSFASENPAP